MKIVLIKLSGKTIGQFTSGDTGVNLINKMKLEYDGVVIVHGGGKLISEWSEIFGHPVNFYEGQRVTCQNTMDVVSSVQGGLINSNLTSYMFAHKIRSIGLNGVDGNSFTADQINENLGFVGQPKQTAEVDWIIDLLKQNFVPVFSSVCSTLDGQLMNVNADIFAAELGRALNVETILFFSDVGGVVLNNKFQSVLNQSQIKSGLISGEINGGMIPKMNSCVSLLSYGINKIWIGNSFDEFVSTSKNKQRGTWIVDSKRIAV